VERKDRRDKYQTVEHKSSSKKLSIENDLLMLCFSKDREIREQIYNNLNIEWMKSDQSKRIYEQIYIHLNSEFEPDTTIILDQLELKEDHHRLASLSFEVDRIAPSISMAKNCIQRLEHMFLKEKLEKYREMLKDTEKSFKDNSELITRITEIQYKMNSIKGAQS
jgi:DNA anti-recombination protein RmuC